jgi:hypothetical protein
MMIDVNDDQKKQDLPRRYIPFFVPLFEKVFSTPSPCAVREEPERFPGSFMAFLIADMILVKNLLYVSVSAMTVFIPSHVEI